MLTTIDASGKLEFDASAYGALGCNILVASAPAGLEKPSCDSTTQLWISVPVRDCNGRIVCYGGNQVRVPLYDHADPNSLWEGSTAPVDRVGGPGVNVHIYRVNDPAIATDALCH